MSQVAGMAAQGLGNEYGLALYGTEEGELRAVVQRGGWFITQVQPEPFVQFPDGDQAVPLGMLAHTHPSGGPTPSQGDHEHMRLARDGPFGLRYSVLATPGGHWSLFDNSSAHHVNARLAEELPLNAFFEPFWTDQQGHVGGLTDLVKQIHQPATP